MNTRQPNPNTPKLTALYERLSRDDELQGPSNSIVNQRELLEDYAKKNGFTNLAHFSDDGYSGTNFDRPDWQRLIAEIEAGNVGTVIVKDVSRVGRDYIHVGLYTDIMFREKRIRFIAINNGIDSANGDNEFAPFLNIMSEWYARDASRKIKSAVKMKGNGGKRLTNMPIYGYRLDPADKTKWIVEDEAAAVVRRIFRMTIEGVGPHMIAKTLATEQVERPSYYMTKRGIVNYTRNAGEDAKYDWNTKSVCDIIGKLEYTGATVNFRTGKESYKDRRRTKNPREEWKVFENTHPAIVDDETWNLAQHCRETKRRPAPDSHGEANPLTGLLFCADCGAKMYNHRKRRTEHLVYHRHIGKYYPSYGSDAYCCANFRSNARSLRDCCTMHYIRTAAVRELLLDTIKNVSAFVKKSEAEFVRQVREASELRQEAAAKASRKQLAKDQKRHAELDTVISKLFEQSAAGKIPEARFDTLLAGYEKEQAELARSVERLKAELQTFDADSVRADKFIELVKKYTDFTELTTPMIHEFVRTRSRPHRERARSAGGYLLELHREI